MKKIFVLILCLFSLSSWAGVFLECEGARPSSRMGEGPSSTTLLVFGMEFLECSDRHGNKFEVDMTGVGAGFEIKGDSRFVVACPLVNKKRIMKGKDLVVVGPAISATAGIGLEIDLGVNHRGAVCLFTGVGKGLGASVLIDMFRISYVKN